GDGVSTVGLFRTSSGDGAFYLKDSNDPATPVKYQFYFGTNGDFPLRGDWTHSGHDSIGLYRPSNGTFYLRNSFTSGVADRTITFPSVITSANRGHMMPFAGDFDGDGYDTIGVMDPTTGYFYYTNHYCPSATPCKVTLDGSFFDTSGTIQNDWLNTPYFVWP